jgi:hypothetical protein
MAFPSNRPPSAAHGEDSAVCRIGVVEPNRTIATKIARVVSCATGFSDVAFAEAPSGLEGRLQGELSLLACDVENLDRVCRWAEADYPSAQVLVWNTGPMAPLLAKAAMYPRITSILGWPSFETMPRSWELSLAARRICDPELPPPRIAELFGWGSTVVKYRPRTTEDRDAVVSEVQWLSEKAGAPPRTAERLAEVSHELLMNAMYDAPVDGSGRPRYAQDRKAGIALEDQEIPTFRLASDGMTLALQVVDTFGRLKRTQVLKSITRGLSASADALGSGAGGGAPVGDVLDTSHGGAGLGLFRIYSASASTVFEVEAGRYTMVTAFFDLNINPREARTMPVSLHFFGKGT